MFTLYTRWDAKQLLAPEDFQFVLSPDNAMEMACIFYEMDYRKHTTPVIPFHVPERRTGATHRFALQPYQRKQITQYDQFYDDIKLQIDLGLMIGLDSYEQWDHIRHPFYFDEESNFIYDCFLDYYSESFQKEVRNIYEACLGRHEGRKPLPTDKYRYGDAPIQHAQSAKTINSKAAGRLLAAGGIYNGNIEGFRQTAEDLGGDAPVGYDQIMNDQTKGSLIAIASIAAGLGLGRLNAASEISALEKLHVLGQVEGEYSILKPGPLADNLADTFSSGAYKEITLSADTTFYRGGTAGKPLGQFFGYEQPQGILQTRVEKALLPEWPNGSTSPLDSYHEIQIPAGTKVYVGEVGYQTELYSGGTEQVLVPTPWKIPGVKILSNGGLK